MPGGAHLIGVRAGCQRRREEHPRRPGLARLLSVKPDLAIRIGQKDADLGATGLVATAGGRRVIGRGSVTVTRIVGVRLRVAIPIAVARVIGAVAWVIGAVVRVIGSVAW